MASHDLLPCPFCGCEPNVGFEGEEDGGYHYVECSNPIFNSNHFCGFHTDEPEDAIRLWNTRVAEIELREALKNMRRLLRDLQPALNIMARKVLDDIIAEQIEAALSNTGRGQP